MLKPQGEFPPSQIFTNGFLIVWPCLASPRLLMFRRLVAGRQLLISLQCNVALGGPLPIMLVAHGVKMSPYEGSWEESEKGQREVERLRKSRHSLSCAGKTLNCNLFTYLTHGWSNTPGSACQSLYIPIGAIPEHLRLCDCKLWRQVPSWHVVVPCQQHSNTSFQ